ncbi:MAG: hypothetical protein IPJ82_00370 [Lewinellaceae bacterium]|nr:hypothetical protein [Lewinellaceae bacterium]
MKYYKLYFDIKKGHNYFSESETMKSPYNYEALDSVWKIPFYGKLVHKPNLDTILLQYTGKRSDMILSVAISYMSGLILSPQLYDIISKFNLDDCEAFPATVEHRRKIYPYIFLHFIGDGNRFIDFEKSLFYVQGAPTEVERVNIGSYDELLEQEAIAANSTPKTRVVAQPLVLQENNIDVDFFRIYGPQYAYYVSERVKLEVEKHDIAGIVFIDPTA